MRTRTKLLLRRVIKEEVRRILNEVSAGQMKKGVGLPYDDGKMAAKFIAIANELGMKQGPYMFDEPSGDYSFDFDQMDAQDGEKVVVVGGKGQGDIKGNNPSAIFILNPRMQKDPTVQQLAKKCIAQYD